MQQKFPSGMQMRYQLGDEVLVQRYDGLIPTKVTKVLTSKMQGNNLII